MRILGYRDSKIKAVFRLRSVHAGKIGKSGIEVDRRGAGRLVRSSRPYAFPRLDWLGGSPAILPDWWLRKRNPPKDQYPPFA